MKEQAIIFGRSHPLAGVVSHPDSIDVGAPAIILLNAGFVHHVGPGRWSVRLARRLAEHGHVVVRFDHGGLGDSDARRDAMSFDESSVAEVREVMDDLQTRHGLESFVLIGLCSGASTAVFGAIKDPRVIGIVGVNPPGGGSGETVGQHFLNETWARRYWTVALFDPRAWWRAATGRIQYRRMLRVLWTQVMNRLRPPDEMPNQLRDVSGWLQAIGDRGARIFLIFSQNDKGRGYVLEVLKQPNLQELLAQGMIEHTTISGTDHTFTLRCSQEVLFASIESFLRKVRNARGDTEGMPDTTAQPELHTAASIT